MIPAPSRSAAAGVYGSAYVPLPAAALFPSLVAYFCFNRGVELVGAARAGQFIHLVPVSTVLLAVVFLGERLAAFQLLGGAPVAAGVAVSSLRSRR